MSSRDVWIMRKNGTCRHVCILSIHGYEKWTLLAGDSCTLQSFHMNCHRQILGVKWHDHVKNSDIAATTSLPNVNDVTARRRLALFGHVVRLDANTPAHQILKHGVQGVDVKSGHRPNAQWRRPPGRPHNSWLQQRLTDRYQTVLESCRRSSASRVIAIRASAAYALRL